MGSAQERFSTIRYPNNLRPKLVIGIKEDGEECKEIECEIIDMNERVIRLTGKKVGGLLPGSKIETQITFSDGASLPVKGEVMINNGNQVYVFIPKSISLSRIVKEQNYVMDLRQSKLL